VISGSEPTPEQRAQLTAFGHRLISRSALSETEFFESIQRTLHRVRPKS
jgi:hypothetical protein